MGKLILGKFLLAANGSVLENTGLAIERDIIKEVNGNEILLQNYPDYEVLDCHDQIISPGFINAHMHLYGVISHGISVPNDIEDFKSFLEDFWWPKVEDRLDHKMIAVTARAMAYELINSGVTALCDILEAPMAIPGALEAEADVLKDVGIKSILSFEASERISKENGLLAIEENINFYNKYKDHPLISGMICLHTTFTCSKGFIRKAMDASKETGAGIQMHLSESKYEPELCLENYGKLPVDLYDELGFFEEPVLAAQGVKLTEEEMNTLVKYGVNMAHLPLSNCEVGGGFAPVPAMLEKGLKVGLGTDGYINNFFEVMRGAFLLHKANLENPEIMPAETVFKMATSYGASAMRMEKAGKLEKGSPADIITIKPELPTPLNRENIFTQLVLYCNPNNVKNVFVNGRQLKANGSLVDTNMKDEYKAVKVQAERLWENNK
ncbi:MAG: amidohydrolase family protein [Spirochaetales bacterium]|nr:amidohydrolase family protein [Spirochaetales bacterium]